MRKTEAIRSNLCFKSHKPFLIWHRHKTVNVYNTLKMQSFKFSLPTKIRTQLSGKYRDSGALIIVFLLGSALRIVNLLSRKSFWDDELFSVLLARKSFWEVFYGAITDVHPPGHLFLLHAFYSIFGDVDWVYRLPSVLTGCGLIIMVYYLAQEFFDKTSALLASFLVSISPFFIQLSNEARSYSLATFTISFMTYSLIKSFRSSEINWFRLYTLSAIVCVYIDHFVWIWLFMANVFLLIKRRFRAFLPYHLRIFFWGLPALVLTVYQILFSTEKIVLQTQNSLALIGTIKKIFAVLWHASTGCNYTSWTKINLVAYSSELLFWIAVATYVGFLIALISAMIKARKDVLLFVLCTSIAPLILLCLIYPFRLESRYVSFIVPPLMIFAAAGFKHLKFGFLGVLAFVTISIFLSLKTLTMPWDPIHKEDYRGVLDYTYKTATENDAVSGVVRAMEYYGPKDTKVPYFRYTTEIPFASHQYNRIFLIEPPLFVDPDKDTTRLDAHERLLAKYGYQLTWSIDFGQDGVHTFVHIFEARRLLKD